MYYYILKINVLLYIKKMSYININSFIKGNGIINNIIKKVLFKISIIILSIAKIPIHFDKN